MDDYYHPRMDREPARSTSIVTTAGQYLLWDLEVRGLQGELLGHLCLRTQGALETGRLVPLAAVIRDD